MTHMVYDSFVVCLFAFFFRDSPNCTSSHWWWKVDDSLSVDHRQELSLFVDEYRQARMNHWRWQNRLSLKSTVFVFSCVIMSTLMKHSCTRFERVSSSIVQSREEHIESFRLLNRDWIFSIDWISSSQSTMMFIVNTIDNEDNRYKRRLKYFDVKHTRCRYV
jgi:predicted secreted hydrolase